MDNFFDDLNGAQVENASWGARGGHARDAGPPRSYTGSDTSSQLKGCGRGSSCGSLEATTHGINSSFADAYSDVGSEGVGEYSRSSAYSSDGESLHMSDWGEGGATPRSDGPSREVVHITTAGSAVPDHMSSRIANLKAQLQQHVSQLPSDDPVARHFTMPCRFALAQLLVVKKTMGAALQAALQYAALRDRYALDTLVAEDVEPMLAANWLYFTSGKDKDGLPVLVVSVRKMPVDNHGSSPQKQQPSAPSKSVPVSLARPSAGPSPSGTRPETQSKRGKGLFSSFFQRVKSTVRLSGRRQSAPPTASPRPASPPTDGATALRGMLQAILFVLEHMWLRGDVMAADGRITVLFDFLDVSYNDVLRKHQQLLKLVLAELAGSYPLRLARVIIYRAIGFRLNLVMSTFLPTQLGKLHRRVVRIDGDSAAPQDRLPDDSSDTAGQLTSYIDPSELPWELGGEKTPTPL